MAKNDNKEKIYVWAGKDKKGKNVKGEIKGVSEALVKVALRSRGVISIDKIKVQKFKTGKKIKLEDVAVFTRQLSTMLKSGVPLLSSFDIVANSHNNPSVTKLLYEIKHEIEMGSSLSAAFRKYPQYFDKLYCNLVEAGEKAGILEMVLARLALYQEKVLGIKSKIKKALIYPIAVIAVALVVTSIIMIFVVPSFESVFKSFGAELPGATLFVVGLSKIFVNYWYLIFGSIFGFFWIFGTARKKSRAFDEKIQKISLKIPVFGDILNKSAVARWCRTLATMFAAGVPLVESLDSVAGAAGNIVYEKATYQIQTEVATGTALTYAMQQADIFPNMLIQMATIGEESGTLDVMLNKVAEFYEEEVDDSVNALSSLMEPFIITFLGVVVGGLVVAMYLPIFKMASTV
jgi:type IV pilus assembly protein PilC